VSSGARKAIFCTVKLKNASVQFSGKHRDDTGTQGLLHDFAQQSKCDDLVSTASIQSMDSDTPRRSNSDTQPDLRRGVGNTAGIKVRHGLVDNEPGLETQSRLVTIAPLSIGPTQVTEVAHEPAVE
jgi:hypothetical protein